MRLSVPLVTAALAGALAGPAVALQPGDPAPAFAAPSTHGPVALADFRGKRAVVLALYFADFTRV